ncbi:hypothetical protein CAPTEDRAFT_199489 [Capitella teleta]|uniref:Uncharacterized protein n=1 Tax=Capitella teleta TaxID=283909 RepID=R7VFS5_CAPTE|nr:hypothetical protein CAPTEDRAFT_199489 [Capitella teleta]|eukprot:ELU14535.1 hypothetical protein CAPTEDRAFT_199489 [Capitella teleta]
MDLNGQGRYELAVAILMLMLIYDITSAFIYVIKTYCVQEKDTSDKQSRRGGGGGGGGGFRCSSNRKGATKKRKNSLFVLKLQRFSDTELSNDPSSSLEHVTRSRRGTITVDNNNTYRSVRAIASLSRQWKETLYDKRPPVEAVCNYKRSMSVQMKKRVEFNNMAPRNSVPNFYKDLRNLRQISIDEEGALLSADAL